MQNINWWKKLLGATTVMLALTALAVHAQETGASLNGVVHDGTGAVLSGVEVTATATATNARTRVKTQSDGTYTLLNLAPGTYTLSAVENGFESYQQTGILLNLDQHATVDITLKVGKVQEEVTVQADVSGVDTVNSELSSEVDGDAIRNLPLNTRESYALLELVPGFYGTIANDYNGVSYSINGGDQQYGDILVDGTPAGFPTVQGYQGVGIFPSVDAIGEFHLLAQNFPAEFGRTQDGIVNVVFKSGANKFHGTAFEYLRTASMMQMGDYFSSNSSAPVPQFHRNQFGGVFDGPIIRDKTFFLVSTEMLYQTTFASIYATVPTDLERTGDFSQSGYNIYNPFSASYSGGNYYRTQYPNNKITSGFSTVAQNFLKYYPEANLSGESNNYYADGSTTQETIAWDARVDHTINNRQKVFARYSNRYYANNPGTLFPSAIAAAEGIIDSQDVSRGVTVGYTATLTPRLIYDFRLGFARTLFDYKNTSRGFQDTALGLPATINAAEGTKPLFPSVIPNDGYLQLGNLSDRHNAFMSYSMLTSLTYLRGKHILKGGFDGRLLRVNDKEDAASAGAFEFSSSWTQGPIATASGSYSGNPIASMLIGVGQGGVYQNYKDVATESYYFAGYLQDDWRLLKKLSANLGVRYDYDTPRTERFNRMNYFNPAIASPVANLWTGSSALTGALVPVDTNGTGRHQYFRDRNNFAPRVGLSYNPFRATVVHVGGALVYGPSNQAASGDAAPFGWAQEDIWLDTSNNITALPSLTLDHAFASTFTNPPGASLGLSAGIGGAVASVIRQSPTPYTVQWGLDIQQQLPFQITADVAYVGNRGRQLITSYEEGIDWDQLPKQDLSLGSALNSYVANPFYGSPYITGLNAIDGPLAFSVTTKGQLLRKYPQYSQMLVYHLMGGDSQYDGLQITLNKRLNSGLHLQGSYVWAKEFDDVGPNGVHQDSFNPKAEYSISYMDIHQRFVASYIYEIPIGRGRKYFGSMGPWLNALAGGWQVNGITTFQGGNPLQITANNSLSAWNYLVLYANWNQQNPKLGGSISSRLSKYFNTSDFSQPGSYSLGNGPAYYNQLRAPGVDNTDFSLFKELTWRGRTAQFRGESFNAFDRTQFAAPDTVVTDSTFGEINSVSNARRMYQLALKILF